MTDYDYPTQIDLDFGDGRYRFFLPMKEINEFEKRYGSIMAAEYNLHSGIGFTRDGKVVLAGEAPVNADVCREIIRLALIGGNRSEIDGQEAEVGPIRAKDLIKLYVYPARPLEESASLAWRILHTAVYGRDGLAEKAA